MEAYIIHLELVPFYIRFKVKFNTIHHNTGQAFESQKVNEKNNESVRVYLLHEQFNSLELPHMFISNKINREIKSSQSCVSLIIHDKCIRYTFIMRMRVFVSNPLVYTKRPRIII